MGIRLQSPIVLTRATSSRIRRRTRLLALTAVAAVAAVTVSTRAGAGVDEINVTAPGAPGFLAG